MKTKLYLIQIIWLVILLQSVAARTVLHRRTEIDADGEKHTKTWTTHETDEDFPSSAGAGDDGFKTFTRNGITLRIKPQITTLRIGGKNISPEQLLEQAKHSKELDLLAVRQLMNTGHPVTRTNIENGRKHTSTYTLEPDGSIVCRKVEDIDLADVERRFEEILKQQQAKQNPNKLSDWEWAEEDKPKEETPIRQAPQQPKQRNHPSQPEGASILPSPPSPKGPTPSSDDIFGHGAPHFSAYPQLPKTWNSNSWSKDDPFNPPELPAFGEFDDDWDAEDHSIPTGETNTFTNTHTDKDGNTVHTSYTTGPNEWKRKTVKISSNFHPTETTTLRSLEEFLKSQYKPSNEDAPHLLPPSAVTTSTRPQPVKTINIEDLQPVAVFNVNKPADEQFLHPLGPNAGAQKPIKTLKIDNIPLTPVVDDSRVERTKVRTLTKTLHSNHPPSAADLDPNMLDILQRAGIRPEDISNSNGHTITKTRMEPDGRIVTTTYRVRPSYGTNGYETVAPAKPYYVSSFPERPFVTGIPFDRPSIFDAPHHSASHFGVDFTPFAAAPHDESSISTSTTATKSLVRDREPIHPELEDVEGAATLNPLLIHPVDSATPASVGPTEVCTPKTRAGKSAIAEFLAKIGISVEDLSAQNGEFVKTIVDDDGRVLTARFVLSAPVTSKCDK